MAGLLPATQSNFSIIEKNSMLIGVLHHPNKPESIPLADKIADWCRSVGHEAWRGSNQDQEEVHRVTATCGMLVVLGGDGSILRAARFAVPYSTPIFGVNMGRVGFLSEATPEEWQQKLEMVMAGEYWIESRFLLHANLIRDGDLVESYMALNDFVVGRGTQARVVRMRLSVDGDEITTYTADALIAATPTGSTAYSMAAGGPLLPPQIKNFLLIPVAPYLSLDRAVVLHQEAEALIHVTTDHGATLTVDGQDAIELFDGDDIVIHKHEHEARFIRVGPSSYFYRRLLKRLGFER